MTRDIRTLNSSVHSIHTPWLVMCTSRGPRQRWTGWLNDWHWPWQDTKCINAVRMIYLQNFFTVYPYTRVWHTVFILSDMTVEAGMQNYPYHIWTVLIQTLALKNTGLKEKKCKFAHIQSSLPFQFIYFKTSQDSN